MKTLNTLRDLEDVNDQDPSKQQVIKDACSLTPPAMANLSKQKKSKKATSPRNKGRGRNKGKRTTAAPNTHTKNDVKIKVHHV